MFGEAADTSFIKAQPASSTDRRRALQALLACPTGSIGCLGNDDPKAVMKDFPLVVDDSDPRNPSSFEATHRGLIRSVQRPMGRIRRYDEESGAA